MIRAPHQNFEIGDHHAWHEDWYHWFREVDIERRGYVRKREFSRWLQNQTFTSGLSRSELDRYVRQADRNADEKIDFEEFCYVMASLQTTKARSVLFRTGQSIVPRSQRVEKFRYLQQYNCCPPPLFIIIITVIEVALYIYYVIDDSYHRGVSISAPVPAYSPLIYDPQRRYQAWRYLSYMFIHIGWLLCKQPKRDQSCFELVSQSSLVLKGWRSFAIFNNTIVARRRFSSLSSL
jgi:rhomboid-related protein 1/2/3